MLVTQTLALLTSIAAVSARPQSSTGTSAGNSTGSSFSSSSLRPNLTAPTAEQTAAFVKSYADLYLEGVKFVQSKKPNWTLGDLAVYYVQAYADDFDPVTGDEVTSQQPLSDMQIAWLNNDYTVATTVNNFYGDWRLLNDTRLNETERSLAHTVRPLFPSFAAPFTLLLGAED